MVVASRQENFSGAVLPVWFGKLISDGSLDMPLAAEQGDRGHEF